MPSNEKEFPLKDESYLIIGCAMEVLNTLGHGFYEKIYENALVVEFELRNIPYEQQRHFDVLYKEIKVGEYVPDLLVYDGIVVDAKTIECISDHERGQIINFMKTTARRVGLILNFKHSRLEWERFVL